MTEYKWIKGQEGRYQIGSNGDVVSNTRSRRMVLGKKVHTGGYLLSSLGERGDWKYIHRLVAQAFIPNPKNLPEVNHKNGDKKDNRVENLEWVSHADNIRHSHKIGLAKSGAGHVQSKAVTQLAEDGSVLKEHGSLNEAARSIGGRAGNIRHCCIGRQPTAYGFKWRFAQ